MVATGEFAVALAWRRSPRLASRSLRGCGRLRAVVFFVRAHGWRDRDAGGILGVAGGRRGDLCSDFCQWAAATARRIQVAVVADCHADFAAKLAYIPGDSRAAASVRSRRDGGA